MLRVLLGRYLDVPPQSVRFEYEEWGKPRLAPLQQCQDLCFNLSHSADLVLYAVTRGQGVGVDVEQIRPVPEMEAIARRVFSTHEIACLSASSEIARQTAFFAAWTRREACLKAVGVGLPGALDLRRNPLAPGQPIRLSYADTNGLAACTLTVHDVQVGAGYAAALAVEGLRCRPHCWELCLA
jgi:4'-phosphopantetheinyl transferase